MSEQYGDGSMMPAFGQDFGPQGVHFEDPQLQQDKDVISSHPLFPLLRLIFQKCELATANPRDSSAGPADVCSAESFSEDISRFASEFKNDPSRQWCYDPNSESDQLMVMAIGVLRLHLLELEKVHELCRSFTDRYIQCLKTKMPVEIVIDDRDSPPLSSNFDEFSGLGFSPAASDKQMSEGEPGSPRANNSSSAMSQDGFPKGISLEIEEVGGAPADIVHTEIISYERAELPRECQPRAPLGSTAHKPSPEMLQPSEHASPVQTLKMEPIHQVPSSLPSTPISVSQAVSTSAGPSPSVSSSISGLSASSGLSPWTHHPVMIEGVVGSMSHHDQIDLNLHSLTPQAPSLSELESSGSSSSKYIPLQSPSVKLEHIEHTKLEPVSENNRLGVFTSDPSEYPSTVGDIDGISTLHATSPSLLTTPSLVQSMSGHPPISSSTLSTLEPSPSASSLATKTPPPTSSSGSVTHSSSNSRKRDSTSDSHDTPSSSSKRVKKEDKDDKKPQPKKRGIFPKQATNILRAWLFQNLTHPYPSEEQKKNLSQQTGLTILQVNNWFINARRRIVQPMIDSSNRAMAPYTTGSYPSPDPYGPGMGVFPHPMHPGLQGFGGGMGSGMGLPPHSLPAMPPPPMPPISRDGGMTNMFSAFGSGQLPNHHSMLGGGGGLHGIGNPHGYPSIPTLPPDLTSLSNSC
ncbi:Oidioi.mRNA.OKI2018_I69.PAR.g12479.t2.cds [Oikopleura dioica]|uniref:Oidioi.mRNA.OKI2018_I69.PAR.g12479.t2.cds n=1 Tax=Oikopleura dioica TaxID=34765 RepID=A0ABN7S5W5_OIKDI|nr:Oidioi.mRNA.OKI2018_I69.PAR.g12479.t2.cds [Oikopleura dioica]